MYRKTIQSKLIRIDHTVIFYEGVSADAMMRDLGNVPVRAVLTEVHDSDPEREFPNADLVLVFHEEKEDDEVCD